MRVLLISHTCQSRTEGQPRADRLARLPGIDLCVLTPDRWLHYGRWRTPERPPDPPFRFQIGSVLWPWAGPAQFYLHWYPGLAQLLMEFKPDIIDLWEEPWGLVSAHACWLRNRLLPHTRIVAETEQNIYKRLPPPFEWFRSYTLRNSNFAIARSDEALKHLRARGYGGPAEVIGNGVDTRLFRLQDHDACQSELGITGFLAGCVGRLVEEKGLMDLVNALPHVSRDVQLVFVGSGPMGPALEARAKTLGRESQVHLLGGRPLEDLPRLMNAFDLLVVPSRTTERWKEQFGRVIIEANACEIPVIGSDSGAIPGVIGAAGIVVPERNPTALAAAIERLRRDSRQRRAMGAAGREQVLAHYSWERLADRYYSVYERLTDS